VTELCSVLHPALPCEKSKAEFKCKQQPVMKSTVLQHLQQLPGSSKQLDTGIIRRYTAADHPRIAEICKNVCEFCCQAARPLLRRCSSQCRAGEIAYVPSALLPFGQLGGCTCANPASGLRKASTVSSPSAVHVTSAVWNVCRLLCCCVQMVAQMCCRAPSKPSCCTTQPQLCCCLSQLRTSQWME
jgi:hypothetical protein